MSSKLYIVSIEKDGKDMKSLSFLEELTICRKCKNYILKERKCKVRDGSDYMKPTDYCSWRKV